MNILVLSLYAPTDTNFQEGIGGAQEVLRQLGKRWVEKGHGLKIISAYRDKKILRKEIVGGIEIERVGSFSNAIFSIWKAYKKEEKWADLVLENSTSYPLYTPLYVRKPLINLMHHLMGKDYIKSAGLFSGSVGIFGELSIPLFYKNTRFIAVSEFTRNQLTEIGVNGTNVRVISNGLDTDFFVPGQNGKNPLILFVGNFADGRKRIEDLIAAFHIVSKKIPDAEIIIAGKGGKKEPMLKELAKKNSKLKYVGMIDAETKKELYQKAWVFANPSIKEGFSLSCLEANACCTPVVTYRLPGLDTINNMINGLVVEQGDVNALANAITMILKDHVFREEMSYRARKFAEGYSWDTATDMYLAEFENVLRK